MAMADQRETRTATERDVTHLPARRGVRCSCGVFIPEGEQHPPIVVAGAQPPETDILWDEDVTHPPYGEVRCQVIEGQPCGVVRGASTGQRLYHYECVAAHREATDG